LSLKNKTTGTILPTVSAKFKPKKKEPAMKKEKQLDFKSLVKNLENINKEFSYQAKMAVNTSLTLRNWFIGAYIHEYELNGSDRAAYGEKIFSELEKELKNMSNCMRRQLYEYLSFYKAYPQIVPTLSAQFKLPESVGNIIQKVPTLSAQSLVPAEVLISKLSYSMLRLLLDIDDETKRAFYEIEAINGGWSVRELKRQINSLYYERSGLSYDKKKLQKLANRKASKENHEIDIRDPFIFEFVGLKSKEVMSESALEDQLLNKVQDFLLELGHGFCFEARQKRILIGRKHYFVDLVLYHRILKCHVLIELKLEEFSHENIGQLNTYLSWYKENIKTEDDNPPVGILLCTHKENALVKFALAGMDNSLFVSKYQLELPKKEDMQKFIDDNIKKAKAGKK
jgi:predicted nuclease of restriction endonuclease-like (RecB) superfamily